MSTRTCLRYWGIVLILLFCIQRSKSEINVALGSEAVQSGYNNEMWTADKVVDGCILTDITSNCCSHTTGIYDDPKEAWWRVDLGNTTTINTITIYYRSAYQHRLAGYQLYLSNTTESPTQGVLCFEDKSSSREQVQLVVTHQCPYVARYVTIYNYRSDPKRYGWYSDYAILELCEVQVFGCLAGRYGDGNCNNQCSGNCFGGNCNSVNGSCFYCIPERYGDKCDINCHINCKEMICDKDTGFCSGCNPGFHGRSCNQTCSGNCKDRICVQENGLCEDCKDGFYGLGCNPCSPGCVNPICNKSSGNCSSCKLGYHGINCDQSCPANCENNQCIQNTGTCIGCDPGYYGNDCYQICSTSCAYQTCDQDIGQCTECKPGLFGEDCDQTCPVDCQSKCDRNTGDCNGCEVRKYGLKCDLTCPDQCLNGKCKQIEGHCEGCIQGFHGDYCSKTCPENCENSTCLQDDGHCTECKDGYFTDHCDESCPSNCVCDLITAYCTDPAQLTESNTFKLVAIGIGIGFGVIILALVVLVVLLVRRRSKNNENITNSTHMTDLSQSARRKDLQKSTDGTYEEIGPNTLRGSSQSNITDRRYEQLDALKREPTHVYETAKSQ